jgi:hypothetical protein
MHRSQQFFDAVIGPYLLNPAGPLALNAADATTLSERLNEDAKDYFYSAAISLASACLALRSESYTWAGIKLYYTTYLAARSTLASNEYAVIYLCGRRQHFALRSLPGQGLAPLGPNTHQSVNRCFQHNLPGHEINTQAIENTHPITWIKKQRERLNYRVARFGDPTVDKYFLKCGQSDLRSLVSLYISDPLYAYDPDHAILALPIRALQSAKENFAINRLPYTCRADELRLIRKLTKDRNGPLPSLLELLAK